MGAQTDFVRKASNQSRTMIAVVHSHSFPLQCSREEVLQKKDGVATENRIPTAHLASAAGLDIPRLDPQRLVHLGVPTNTAILLHVLCTDETRV